MGGPVSPGSLFNLIVSSKPNPLGPSAVLVLIRKKLWLQMPILKHTIENTPSNCDIDRINAIASEFMLYL